MKLALMLPAAALCAAVGWLGYKLVAPPPKVVTGYVVPGPPGATKPILVKRHRPAQVRFAPRTEPGAPEAGKGAPASSAGAAALPSETPRVIETLPNGEPRPVNVVRGTPEEMAVHSLLTPLVSRHKDANLNFVRCDDTLPAPAAGEEPGPLEAPQSDPKQPVCFARMQARDPATLRDILRDASTTYKGHMAVDVRLHTTAYMGAWYEADVRVATDEPYSVPELDQLSQL
jgi:hypothetical protein